jgi:hypothetical protein
MLGTMLHPCELDVPQQKYRVWTTTGGKGHMEDFAEPAILTSSWLAPDGSIGHVFANPTEEPRELAVMLDTRNQPSQGPYDVSVYTSATGAFASLWQKTELPRSYATEIPSLGVVFVEIRRR